VLRCLCLCLCSVKVRGPATGLTPVQGALQTVSKIHKSRLILMGNRPELHVNYCKATLRSLAEVMATRIDISSVPPQSHSFSVSSNRTRPEGKKI
jgi:hypothetical protein